VLQIDTAGRLVRNIAGQRGALSFDRIFRRWRRVETIEIKICRWDSPTAARRFVSKEFFQFKGDHRPIFAGFGPIPSRKWS
jgi:hypothetical protein